MGLFVRVVFHRMPFLTQPNLIKIVEDSFESRGIKSTVSIQMICFSMLLSLSLYLSQLNVFILSLTSPLYRGKFVSSIIKWTDGVTPICQCANLQSISNEIWLLGTEFNLSQRAHSFHISPENLGRVCLPKTLNPKKNITKVKLRGKCHDFKIVYTSHRRSHDTLRCKIWGWSDNPCLS